MRYYLVLLFGIILLASACTQNAPKLSNDGLEITSFDVEPRTAEITDNVRFFLDVENVGGTTASCIKAELQGVGSWYDTFGAPYTAVSLQDFGLSFNYFDSDNFNICYDGNLLTNIASGITGTNIYGRENICYQEYGDFSSLSTRVNAVWGQFLASPFCVGDFGRTVQVRPELRPAEPDFGRAGQGTQFEWVLAPPRFPEGQRVEMPVTARVSYAYKSSATVNIPVVSKAEYRRIVDAGKGTLPSLQITNVNAAPIQIAMKSGNDRIIIDNNLPVPAPENYLFEFQNVGGGFPLPVSRSSSDGFIFGTIEVRGPGAYFSDCMGYRNTNVVFASVSRLRKSDNSYDFSCNVVIDPVQWGGRDKDTVTVVFDLWYIYYTEKQAFVTVLGRREVGAIY